MLKNEIISHSELQNLLNAKKIGVNENILITDICLDSRNVTNESLFVPLVGEKQNGNTFIENALIKGCATSLVTRDYYINHMEEVVHLSEKYNAVLFIVENTLKALHNIAKFYKEKFTDLTVITVTGSCGKTTTKEILGSILKRYKPSLVTEGNLNSETGLPLTVFKLNSEHKIALFEMGMSKPGEIKALVDIVNPDIGIITNIGRAHIGFFDSIDGIASEKKDSFSNFTAKNVSIIPGWDRYSEFLTSDVPGKSVIVSDRPEYLTNIVDLGFKGWEFCYNGQNVKFPYLGKYNFLNAQLAISCARELGIPDRLIVDGLENLPVIFGRGEIIDGKNRVIRDCYNANPDSTLNSLLLLEKTAWDGEKVPVLGSMLELGECSEAEHLRIANEAASRFSKVIFYGKEYKSAFSSLKNRPGIYFSTEETEIKNIISRVVKPDSLILLKGSRGVRLEKFTEDLIK